MRGSSRLIKLLERFFVVGEQQFQSIMRLGSDGSAPSACRRDGRTHAELSTPRSGSVAVDIDVAFVVGDDAIGDRQAQSDSLPSAAAREERFEQMLAHFVGQPAAVVGENQLGLSGRAANFDHARGRRRRGCRARW